MVRTQIQLTEDQSRRLKDAAARRGVSAAELIRQGVDLVLEQEVGVTRDALRDRARDAVGRFRSWHRDVSRRHDEHLREAYRR